MRAVAASLLAALGGFIVLVLEIIGARYLAKDFGGSFYVWVSQIGVIMLALACGYYIGGAMVDKNPRLIAVGLLLIAAGAFTYGVPLFAPPVIDAIVSRHPIEQPVPRVWQKVDPALGSACVFFFPCLALAMLPPYLIRWLTSQVDRLGRSSGVVIAAGTVGSIAGVFVAGYILIDVMRISDIFRLMGVLTGLAGALSLGLDFWFKPNPEK